MDFHLDRKIILSNQSEYESLYSWSLQEFDEVGKKIGGDQVPWNWTLWFTAVDIALSEDLSLEAKRTPDAKSDNFAAEESRCIRATLRPGYFADADSGPRYSMFGTGREIKSFGLSIYPLDDEAKDERCHAWGCPSYTTEIDFRDEAQDDTVQIYLYVSRARFSQYVEMLRSHPANIVVLRLGSVSGFYSEWSPSISTDKVKVLTNLDDHKVTIPENTAVVPPALGRIGKFEITFITKRYLDKPANEQDEDDIAELTSGVDGSETGYGYTRDRALALQKATMQFALRNEGLLKQLTYAAWAILVLLIVLVFRK